MSHSTLPPTGLEAGTHDRAIAPADAVSNAAAFRAYCASDGVIFYGTATPEGSIEIVRGPEQLVRDRVDVAARHGRPDRSVQLVPGVPEAKSQDDGLLALSEWINWFSRHDSDLDWNRKLEDRQ